MVNKKTNKTKHPTTHITHSNTKMSEPFYIDRNGPLSMKKSAGVGVRFFMPGIGKLGFDMGYGFDDINGDGEAQGWEYTITFGQTF
jgi:outer membrane protein insertion porin family